MRMQGMTRTLIVMVFLVQTIHATCASVHQGAAHGFLYTQNNKDNTRSLFRVTVQPRGIVRQKLDQQPYATYPWTDTLCLRHNTLFAMNYSGLFGLDLETGRATRLVSDVLPHYDRLSCLDDRAYGLSRDNDQTQDIMILDFDRFAYRAFCPNPKPCDNPAIVPSPSHELLAYYTHDPNGYRLAVIKTETGELVCQSPPFEFQLPMIASVFSPPPLAWVDEHRILSIETYTRGKFASLILKKRKINQLTVLNLNTGRFRHISTLPGNPLTHFPPQMIQPITNLTPRLVVRTFGILTDDYRVNLEARKLVKDSIMGSPYRLDQGRLLFKGTALGQANRYQVNVDPTGTRIVWLQDGNLHYHDDTRADAILVAKECEIRGVTWIDPKAWGRDLSGTPLPDGWTRF